MKKGIRNDLSVSLKDKKWYNPNSFTSMDATICFLVVMVCFLLMDNTVSILFSYLFKNGIIKDYYLVSIISTLFSQGVIILIAFIFCRVRHVNMFSGGGYRYKFEIVDTLFAIMLTLGVFCVFSATHSAFIDDVYYSAYGAPYSVVEYIPEDIALNSNPIFILVYVYILVPLLPAICEEALFRGVILRGYSNRNTLFCIIVSSMIFAVMHGNFGQLILQFIGGVAICAVVFITKNFLIGAIMHFTNNFCVQVLYVLQASYAETTYYADYFIDAFYIVYGIVFLIISIVYFSKKVLKQYKLKILNKKPIDEYKTVVSCLSKDFECDSKYQEVKMADCNFSELSKDKNVVFLYKDSFIKINTNKNSKVEKVLFVIALVLAIISIFLAL